MQAIYRYGLAEGAFAADSPVARIIREAVLSHSDERVRLMGSWVMQLASRTIDDEKTGIMVMGQIRQSGRSRINQLEAENILQVRRRSYQSTLDDETSSAGAKDLARLMISEMDRYLRPATTTPQPATTGR